MEKILNKCMWIFLCSIITHDSLKIRAQLKLGRLAMIGIKYAWKRFEKICMKIKYSFHQCKGIWTYFSTLIWSHTYTNANLMPKDLEAAPKHHKQLCIFSRKFQNWKHDFKEFQGKTLIPLHSWGFKEGFWIKTIISNARNW